MKNQEQINMSTANNAYEQFEQKHGVEPEVFLSFMSISQLLDLAKHLGVSFGEYEGGAPALVEYNDKSYVIKKLWDTLKDDVSRLEDFWRRIETGEMPFTPSAFYEQIESLGTQADIINEDVALRPLRFSDISTVHMMMKEEVAKYLVPFTVKDKLVDWVVQFMRISENMHDYRLICKEKYVYGLLYVYDFAKRDNHAFLSVLMTEQSPTIFMRAMAGYLDYYFNGTPMRKIYFDVYDTNEHTLRIIKKMPMIKKEGYFEDFRFIDGKYVGVYRFVLTKGGYEDLKDRYAKYFAGIART